MLYFKKKVQYQITLLAIYHRKGGKSAVTAEVFVFSHLIMFGQKSNSIYYNLLLDMVEGGCFASVTVSQNFVYGIRIFFLTLTDNSKKAVLSSM